MTRHWKIAVMRNAGKNPVSSNRVMTRLFYNAMGRFYDLFYHRSIRGYVESAGCLMEDLVGKDDRVLDVGCGTGLLTFLAAPQAKQVVGVDLAVGMLQKARKKKTSNDPVFFVNGDALKLPLNAQFDVCVSAFMLVMLPKEMRWRVIAEMNRLLKPGGRMAFLSSRPELGEQWLTREEWETGLLELGLEGVTIQDEGDVFLNVVATKPEPAAITESTAEEGYAASHTYEDTVFLPETFPALSS